MKIGIERIKVDESTRIHQEIGDLTKLEESIKQVGLINPILIDEQDILVAGFRRLSACKNLGWKEIEVNVVELEGDELKMLETEVAENLFCKEFTPEEIMAIQKRREEIEEARRPKGVFERFGTWVKGLFKSKPKTQTDPEPTQTEPKSQTAAETQQPPENESPEEVKAEVKQEEQPEPESNPETEIKAEPAVDPEPKPDPSVSPQPTSAEIVETDGVRHIKWRQNRPICPISSL